MNVLVTGGTGFLGAWVVRALRERGYAVTAFDFAPNRAHLEEVLGAPDDDLRVLDGDVSDLPRLLRAVREAEAERIVHLAGLLGSGSDANPLRTLRVNCEGTLNVFEAALAAGVGKVVWASSSAVFGSAARRGRRSTTRPSTHRRGCTAPRNPSMSSSAPTTGAPTGWTTSACAFPSCTDSVGR
jgi:nucleoside-diphosphate-sugar epimerase